MFLQHQVYEIVFFLHREHTNYMDNWEVGIKMSFNSP